jgi:UDP-glucose 4-epimerase
MKLLITGASGFLGGFIVDSALNNGYEVVAAIRKNSSKKYLQDERIEFLELNLSDSIFCSEQLSDYITENGNIDAIIHNAGVTKAIEVSDYAQVNFEYTKNFIQAILSLGIELQKFVYISSLAASGPGNPESDEPIIVSTNNHPVTAYGKSKLLSEDYIRSLDNFPFIILRPPAVFGPRDKDMFEVFSMVNKGLEIFVGGHTQHLSFVYVKDLAEAIVKSVSAKQSMKTYFISDNQKYTSMIFSNLVKKSMGKRTIVIKLPIFLVYLVAFFAEMVSKLTKNPSPLNIEKIKELKCANWLCDASDFHRDMNFKASYTLEEGIIETVYWYKKEKWI